MLFVLFWVWDDVINWVQTFLLKIFSYLRISSVGTSTECLKKHTPVRGPVRAPAGQHLPWTVTGRAAVGTQAPSQGGSRPSVPTLGSRLACRKGSSNLQARTEQETVSQEGLGPPGCLHSPAPPQRGWETEAWSPGCHFLGHSQPLGFLVCRRWEFLTPKILPLLCSAMEPLPCTSLASSGNLGFKGPEEELSGAGCGCIKGLSRVTVTLQETGSNSACNLCILIVGNKMKCL